MNDETAQALTAQLAGFAEVQRLLLERVEAMANAQAVMRAELTENTKMMQSVRDASAFVRVGTTVLKWIGIVVIAIGSIIAGVKLSINPPAPPEIGPRP